MRYKHNLRVQSNSQTVGTDGQPVDSWSTYWVGWGNVEDKAGEEVQGQPIEGVVRGVCEIPYPRTGRIPQPTDRILYAENRVTRTLHIDAVRRGGGQRRALLLEYAEVQSS